MVISSVDGTRHAQVIPFAKRLQKPCELLYGIIEGYTCFFCFFYSFEMRENSEALIQCMDGYATRIWNISISYLYGGTISLQRAWRCHWKFTNLCFEAFLKLQLRLIDISDIEKMKMQFQRLDSKLSTRGIAKIINPRLHQYPSNSCQIRLGFNVIHKHRRNRQVGNLTTRCNITRKK